MRLAVTLGSEYAAFQDAGAVFSGGAALKGGTATACGLIAQPVVAVTPRRVCFHSDAPKTVYAAVSPEMDGSFQWSWGGGPVSSSTGRHANISWGAGASEVAVTFTAAGASGSRSAYGEVTRCARADEEPETPA